MYSLELLLHLCGVILSSSAAFLALRLIPFTGKSKAWLLISVAIIMMAIERTGELLANTGMIGLTAYAIFADSLWVLISALLLMGVLHIRALFLERIAAKTTLEKNLDELQRFHDVSIGRELRMKALFEENHALKSRLKELQK